MDALTTLSLLVIVALVVGGLWWLANFANQPHQERLAALTPEQRAEYDKILQHGKLNPALVCPHCTVKGSVRAKPVTKTTQSTTRTTNLILNKTMKTTSQSVVTRMNCGNCAMTWEV